MTASNPNFHPWCPKGGNWYACGNGTRFTGCCDSYPCTNNGCFAGNLRPASFDPSAYGQFPDQVCGAGSWYTCTGTNPAFMGCCVSNPCQQNGCPSQDLRAGYLSANAQEAMAYDPQPPLPGTPSSTTAAGSQPSSNTTATQLAAPSSTHLPVATSTPIGAIAGAAVGGAIFVLLVGLAIFFIIRRRRHQQTKQNQNHNQANINLLATNSGRNPSQQHYSPYFDDHKPPMYSTGTYAIPPSELPTPSRSPATSPHIHEAASREVSYTAYSPHPQPPSHSPHLSTQGSPCVSSQLSPVWSSDRLSGAQSVQGLGVRGVSGNSEYSRAELR